VEDIMNTSGTIKSKQTKRTAAVNDLALKPGQDVRGGGIRTSDIPIVMPADKPSR
jgi:hypothetical protein